MEQKKTLWIIAAVGTFLLVVLGTAGILYSPSRNSNTKVATVAPTENKKNGWSEDKDGSASLPIEDASTKTKETIVFSENTKVYNLDKDGNETEKTESDTTIDLNTLKNSDISASQPQQQNINITVKLPENSTKPAEVNSDASNVNVTAKTEPVPLKEPTKTVSSSTPKAPTKEKEVSKPATKKPASTGKSNKVDNKKVNQYWVQVASYSNKKGAENAKVILDNNKISSDIFTHEDDKGKLYYRVRVGPYTTKSEAEYWRSKILNISEFKDNDSYITRTTK